MKDKMLTIVVILMCGTIKADTNYIYSSSSGVPQLVGRTYEYNADRDVLTLGDASLQGIDWTVMKLSMTTDALPVPFTNISQVTAAVVLPLTTDQKTDWEIVVDRKLKAVVTGLVKAYNAKLPAQYRPTALEIKKAIKEELAK